jgi:hypothetical protein
MAGNTVYVQGNYVDVHDNEVVNLSIDKVGMMQMAEGQEAQKTDIPKVLAESELWKRAMEAGLVNEQGQPTVSRPEAALLADVLARRLGIDNKWKVFEKMWQRNNMRNDYNTALDQKKSLAFQEKLKKILG